MSIIIKVLNGTVQRDSHMCWHCARYTYRMEGNKEGGMCNQFGPIRQKVTQCSEFHSHEDDFLGKLREQAWMLYNNADSEPVFVSPLEREMQDNPYSDSIRTRSRRRRHRTSI
jgi:hypothetical protein